jgi:hypothetical protein
MDGFFDSQIFGVIVGFLIGCIPWLFLPKEELPDM